MYSNKDVSRIRPEDLMSLLKWWGNNSRDFPWRHTRDPFLILITEMLLRKTTAKQVEKVYDKIIMMYGTPKKLAEANETELVETIRPLGMEHKRALLLIRLSSDILNKHGGKVPSNKKDLLELPGVGQYAANAVLCFGYGNSVSTIDTNFIRVFQRFTGIKSSVSRPRNDTVFLELINSVMRNEQSRDINYGILDLAALICKPKNPKCIKCPLKSECSFFNNK